MEEVHKRTKCVCRMWLHHTHAHLGKEVNATLNGMPCMLTDSLVDAVLHAVWVVCPCSAHSVDQSYTTFYTRACNTPPAGEHKLGLT